MGSVQKGSISIVKTVDESLHDPTSIQGATQEVLLEAMQLF